MMTTALVPFMEDSLLCYQLIPNKETMTFFIVIQSLLYLITCVYYTSDIYSSAFKLNFENKNN